MRDLVIMLIFFSTIPYVVYRPYVGILVWSWIGYMNPHRLSYGGPAYSFPFAVVIGVLTIALAFFSPKVKKRFPITPVTIFLILFILWMLPTTFFALEPTLAKNEFIRTLKIQAVVFLTLMLMDSKKKLDALVWVIAVSIGFYGYKGGIFAIATGGSSPVLGPKDSFITGNNEIALALVMILPFILYLIMELKRKMEKIPLTADLGFFRGRKFLKYVRWCLMKAFFLCSVAVLFTYSRGGFICLMLCFFFMILRSKRRKLYLGLAAVALVIGAMNVPQKLIDRMDSIGNYEEDESMQGRYDSWWFATYLALDRPLVGGGFRTFTQRQQDKYYPVDKARDAHSIYFEVLGEQGFVGLFFYLMFNTLGLLTGFKIKSAVKGNDELEWARDLASMMQISLVCFAVGGLAKGMAYWDLPYHIVAILVLTRVVVEKQLAEKSIEAEGRFSNRGFRNNKRQALGKPNRLRNF